MSIVNFDSDVCALTDTGLVRFHNEDSNRVERTNNGDLFVVCDGMGGHAGGAIASKIGVNSICQYVMEHDCSIPQHFLIKALEYANENIFEEARSNSGLKGMGTTACVALVRGDKVWYAHVGDSRIYYYNSFKNALYRLTKDHSVVQALVDQGMITEAEAEHHPEKNKIRKSLGIKKTVEAEPCQMPLIPSDGDVMLICSDGLSGMIDEDDILEVLSTTPNVNEAGKTLIERAKAGGGTDNITVQIIKFSGVGVREAVFDAKNKGITASSQKKDNDNNKRQIWPLLLLSLSIVLFIIAGCLYLSNSSDNESIIPQIENNSFIDEEAYKKELTQSEASSWEEYKDASETPYRFYKRPSNPKGDLIVFWGTKDYHIGHFKWETARGGFYDPYNSSDGTTIEKYKRDGSPK